MKKAFCYIILMTVLMGGHAQKNTATFQFWEDSLITLRDRVMQEPDETTRLSLNEDFMSLLEEVLQMPNSFQYGWDSIHNFAILASPDHLFKIFTWYIVKANQNVENFGFIQVYNEARKKYVLFPLYDKRNVIDFPKSLIGNHNKWYGAVYYKLIPIKEKNATYYTLLGWNGNNLFTNQKIIEILHFNKDMTPVFGARVFKGYPERVTRVILEYSKNASLHLSYENQQYMVSTGKFNPKTQQTEYKLVNSPMIIYNELIPMENGMEGLAAYLVPESSMSQGFLEQDGQWHYMKQVRGTNPDKPKPDYQYKPREIYKP